MSEFLKLFDKVKSEYGLYLTITANSSNVELRVHRLDLDHDMIDYIVFVSDEDMEVAFAEAHFRLYRWMKEHTLD